MKIFVPDSMETAINELRRPVLSEEEYMSQNKQEELFEEMIKCLETIALPRRNGKEQQSLAKKMLEKIKKEQDE